MPKTWLEFVEEFDTGKTKVWAVYSAQDWSELGRVKWYGPWRQYVYDTLDTERLIWNSDCLDELTAFIRERMAERKVKTQ